MYENPIKAKNYIEILTKGSTEITIGKNNNKVEVKSVSVLNYLRHVFNDSEWEEVFRVWVNDVLRTAGGRKDNGNGGVFGENEKKVSKGDNIN